MWISRLLIISILLLATGWWIGHVLTTPGKKPVIISAYSDAAIQAEDRIADVGMVATDSHVDAVFHLYNVGGRHLRIYKVDTSCGCTVADISRRVIAPGDYARLTVNLDTSLKLGKVKKKITLYTNDPEHLEYNLYLIGTVVTGMEGHEPIAVKDPLVLFKGECATCHVEKGRGKTGKELFVADCAMCHGMDAQGRPDIAPSLLTGNPHDPAFVERLRKITSEGSPNTPEMPPFSKDHGGPLSAGEIESLVNFLKFQTALKDQGLLEAEPEDEEYAELEELLKNRR